MQLRGFVSYMKINIFKISIILLAIWKIVFVICNVT